MKLSELKTGERAYIVKVSGHGGFRKRIIEMGFIKGQPVEALLNAPLRGRGRVLRGRGRVLRGRGRVSRGRGRVFMKPCGLAVT